MQNALNIHVYYNTLLINIFRKITNHKNLYSEITFI